MSLTSLANALGLGNVLGTSVTTTGGQQGLGSQYWPYPGGNTGNFMGGLQAQPLISSTRQQQQPPPPRIPGFTYWACPRCKREFDTYVFFHMTLSNGGYPFIALCHDCWKEAALGERLRFYDQKFKSLGIENPEMWKEISAAVWAGK